MLDCAGRTLCVFSVALSGDHAQVTLAGTKPGQLIVLLSEGGDGVAWDPLIEWRSGLPDSRIFNRVGTTLHAFIVARRPSRRGHNEPMIAGWKVR